MTGEWKQYQEATAQFFRSLGLNADVELDVAGVRGLHSVDVFVKGSYYGIDFKWVVECKAWKSNVPKEKVMVLAAIVQDVGADRGFLLSEKGFQSGAIRAASNSNITLASIGDLSLTVREPLTEAILAKLNWRLNRVKTRLRDLKKQSEGQEKIDLYFGVMEQLGKLSVLDLSIDDAAKGIYPNFYKLFSDKTKRSADSFEELIGGLDGVLCEAENAVKTSEVALGNSIDTH
jgi:hypothetical protein